MLRKLYVRLSLLSGTGMEFFASRPLDDLADYAEAVVEVREEMRKKENNA